MWEKYFRYPDTNSFFLRYSCRISPLAFSFINDLSYTSIDFEISSLNITSTSIFQAIDGNGVPIDTTYWYAFVNVVDTDSVEYKVKISFFSIGSADIFWL